MRRFGDLVRHSKQPAVCLFVMPVMRQIGPKGAFQPVKACLNALTGCAVYRYKSSLWQQHLIDDVNHTVICHDVGLNDMGIIHAYTMLTVDLDLVPFDR